MMLLSPRPPSSRVLIVPKKMPRPLPYASAENLTCQWPLPGKRSKMLLGRCVNKH
jgi:hypothetical protein